MEMPCPFTCGLKFCFGVDFEWTGRTPLVLGLISNRLTLYHVTGGFCDLYYASYDHNFLLLCF